MIPMAEFKIKLIKSAFMDEVETRKKLAEFVLNTEFFSMSKECKKFEETFAKKQERKYAVFVNSGSSANLVLIQALLNLGKLKKGDRVGISSITWSTNVMPLLQLGLVPVAIDCEFSSLNVSPKTIEKEINGLQGLFLTNVLGFADDIAAIKKMCAEKNVIFIEDNCESLGSKADGVFLGNFGLASTFSFFVGHHLSTLEGGMICTDDEELYHMCIMARAHGWDRNLPEAQRNELRAAVEIDPFYALYTFFDLGYNVRPTELNGFLGNIQIAYWDEIVENREKNFRILDGAIRTNPDFIPLELEHMSTISNFAVPALCKTKDLFNKYKKKFQDAGVEIRPIIAGNIVAQPFYKKYVRGGNACPNASFIHENGFYCGNNPELTTEELSVLGKLFSNSELQ